MRTKVVDGKRMPLSAKEERARMLKKQKLLFL